MRLSYVIASHNRRDRLLQTLATLPAVTPLPEDQWEIWVVDNASSDGSAKAVADQFPHVNLIRNGTNQGALRNHALQRCSGQYIMPLHDDAYPADDRCVITALAHLDSHRTAGAICGKILNASGIAEAPPLPTVLSDCASCLRKSALDQIGGFRPEFFHKAGEMDLSLRLWRGGFNITRHEGVIFRHDRPATPENETVETHHSENLRNHLIIAQRYLPDNLRPIYWDDWRLQYEALARHAGDTREITKALWFARLWAFREAMAGREPLGPEMLENIFGFRHQATLVGEWARRNSVWRVAIGDLGHNIWATYNACHSSGLQMRCVIDHTPAFQGLHYRGLPIMPAHEAFDGGGIDGVVVSNINPAEVEARTKSLTKLFKGPVLRLWEPPRLATQARATAA